MNKPSQVIIYTDGACSDNPGPGGYGVVMMHADHRRELSAGYRLTTNNRMELTGGDYRAANPEAALRRDVVQRLQICD